MIKLKYFTVHNNFSYSLATTKFYIIVNFKFSKNKVEKKFIGVKFQILSTHVSIKLATTTTDILNGIHSMLSF